MKKFNKNDLRLAFESGIDFAIVNKNVSELNDSGAFRDKGFDDIYSQMKKIKKIEKRKQKSMSINS